MIGILALQGGFAAHAQCLDRLGLPNTLVKRTEQLEGLDGLIIPGGESTTMLKLMANYQMFDTLKAFGERGIPVLGTCAGAILMSLEIRGRDQKSFGWLPVTIDRNAYGSQRESFSAEVDFPPWSLTGINSLFIRAPRFIDLGPDVQVLCHTEKDITGISYRHFTAVTHHPELGGGLDFHRAWYDRCIAPKAMEQVRG